MTAAIRPARPGQSDLAVAEALGASRGASRDAAGQPEAPDRMAVVSTGAGELVPPHGLAGVAPIHSAPASSDALGRVVDRTRSQPSASLGLGTAPSRRPGTDSRQPVTHGG